MNWMPSLKKNQEDLVRYLRLKGIMVIPQAYVYRLMMR